MAMAGKPEEVNHSRRDLEPSSSSSNNTWKTFLRGEDQNGGTNAGYNTGGAMQQLAHSRLQESAAQLSSQSSQALLRFMQYQRRFNRRRERLSALGYSYDYDKEKLRAAEKWRSDSCEDLFHEMHDAVQKIRAATVMDEVNISLHRLEETLERFKKDGEEVSKQERTLMRAENTLEHAQGKLNRVIDSMMTSARKCIDYSGLQQTESWDMISNSTMDDSPTVSSHPTPKPPALIELYFDKLGQKNIMFERLAEIEFARREDMIQREVLRDQADPEMPDYEDFREQDEAYNREVLHASNDYNQALAEFESIERQCRDNKLDLDEWRTSGNTEGDEEDDDNDNDTAVGHPKRKPTDNLIETMTTITDKLTAAAANATTAIGPAPDDPDGLVTTVVYTGGSNGHLDAGAEPKQTVVDWMETLPDQTRSRIPSTTESPVPMQADKQRGTSANTSTEDLLALSMDDLDSIDVEEPPCISGALTTGRDETSMDMTMMNMHSHPATDSVVGVSRAEPHSIQLKSIVNAAIDDLNEQASSMHIVPTLQQHIAAEQAAELEKSAQGLPQNTDLATPHQVMDQAETDKITQSVIDQLNATTELFQGKDSMEDIDRLHDAIDMAASQAMSANIQSPRTPNANHQRSESGKFRMPAEDDDASPPARASDGKTNTVRWAQDLVNEHTDSPSRASPALS